MANSNGGAAWLRAGITILGFVLSALTAGLAIMDRVNERFATVQTQQHAMELKFGQLQSDLERRSADRWTAKHMIIWAARLDRANGDIQTPDPADVLGP